MSSRRLLLVLWLAFVVLVLVWTTVSYGSAPHQLKNEILLRHGIVMLAASVPSGWLLSALLSAVLSLAGLELAGVTDAFVVSLACGAAGYLQWFVFVPWLWRRWTARRQRPAGA